jgi:replicative DNA helicase
MLIDKDVLPIVGQILRPEDFYAEKHQTLYSAMSAIIDRHEPVDIITVQDELKRRGDLDDIGGLTYLTTLVNLVPSTANVDQYARIVADKADVRRIQTAARKIVDESYGDITSADLKKVAIERVQGAVFHRGGTGVRQLGPELLSFVETQRNASVEGKPPAALVKVPFKRQHYVMPWLKGETTAVGAGSNIGKTTYMFNTLKGVAELDGPAIGFSLEMSSTQILQKFWARIAGVNTLNIRHGALTDDEWNQSIIKIAKTVNLPLWYMVKPRMKWTEIAMEATAFKAKHGKLSLIMVDYWQILNDMPQKDERRDNMFGRLVEEAKELAVTLDCHVAFLVQTYIRPDQPFPTLADVIESRDIVRYVDNSLFLTRPTEFIGTVVGKKGERTSPTIKLPRMDGSEWVDVSCEASYPPIAIRGEQYRNKRMFDNIMIGIQGKQRMGPKDIIPYWIDLPTGKMADLATPWPWDNKNGATPHQEVPD